MTAGNVATCWTAGGHLLRLRAVLRFAHRRYNWTAFLERFIRMAKFQIGIIHLDFPENPEEESKEYVTCLSTERLFRYAGIPSEGIIGQLLRPLGPGERITPGNFAANKVFVDLMQGVI